MYYHQQVSIYFYLSMYPCKIDKPTHIVHDFGNLLTFPLAPLHICSFEWLSYLDCYTIQYTHAYYSQDVLKLNCHKVGDFSSTVVKSGIVPNILQPNTKLRTLPVAFVVCFMQVSKHQYTAMPNQYGKHLYLTKCRIIPLLFWKCQPLAQRTAAPQRIYMLLCPSFLLNVFYFYIISMLYLYIPLLILN